MNIRRHLTACIAVLLVGSRCYAAGTIHVPEPTLPVPLTLQEAIAIGLGDQSAVGIAVYQADSSKAGTVIANSSYYPQATPTFDYSNQRTTGPSTGGGFGGGFGGGSGDSNGTTQTTQLSLKQLVVDNGTREESAASSRNEWRADEYGLEDTRQTVILTIATDYYDLLRNKELAKVASANVDTTKTTLDATTAEADAGTIAHIQILQAQANYQNAVVQQITADNNVHISEVTLKNAIGIYGSQQIVTPDTPLPVPDPTADTKTADDYLTAAIANRPDVQRAFNLIDADRHNVHAAQLASSLQVQGTASDLLQGQPTHTTDKVLAIDLSYPLLDGGASRARVRQSEDALEQTRLTAEQTVENAQDSVTQAYLQREAARSSTVASQVALSAAQQNFTAAQDSQKEGVSTIIDVITAQQALVTAETNNVQAVYDYYTADAQLQRAIGANDPGPIPIRLTHAPGQVSPKVTR